MKSDGPYMQVLVCTFGEKGISRLAESDYPEVEGVEYLVSWQLPDDDCEIPDALSRRKDFNIVKTKSRGLSRNRNEALQLATAPVVMIADDDLHYDPEALSRLMDYHRANPTHDLVCTHITVGGERLDTYCDVPFPLSKSPKNYYFISCEISFKRKPVMDTGIRFEEDMGAGAPVFPSGEEEIFMRSLLRKGLRGVCIPLIVADHPAPTTGDRLTDEPSFVLTKGAILRFRYPSWWIFQLPKEALKISLNTTNTFFRSCALLVKGARLSKRLKEFNIR